MDLPPEKNLIRIGVTDAELFVQRGQIISESLKAQMQPRGIFGSGKKILDFGGGVGCVSNQMSDFFEGSVFISSDVDQSAIDFLSTQDVSFIPVVNLYNPPLPFGKSYFDAVYAISVFTHFDKETEACWLKELQRVTKKDGWLFLSIAGKTTLENHHNRGNNLDINDSLVSDEGILFKENSMHGKDVTRWPGITGPYGVTYHSLEYINSVWSQYFTIDKILTPGIVGQDLIILRNNKIL